MLLRSQRGRKKRWEPRQPGVVLPLVPTPTKITTVVTFSFKIYTRYIYTSDHYSWGQSGTSCQEIRTPPIAHRVTPVKRLLDEGDALVPSPAGLPQLRRHLL